MINCVIKPTHVAVQLIGLMWRNGLWSQWGAVQQNATFSRHGQNE